MRFRPWVVSVRQRLTVKWLCSHSLPFPDNSESAWWLWLAALVIEPTVLLMICHSLCRSFAGFRSSTTSPLLRLLIRDAFARYAATTFNNGFIIICLTIYCEVRLYSPFATRTLLSFPVLAIAGQGLVLNPRGMRAHPSTSTFASRMVQRQLEALEDEPEWWHPSDESSSRRATINIALEPIERSTLKRIHLSVHDFV
ncbi:hypothetical protein V8E55_005277 [Tylopilus felleus]